MSIVTGSKHLDERGDIVSRPRPWWGESPWSYLQRLMGWERVHVAPPAPAPTGRQAIEIAAAETQNAIARHALSTGRAYLGNQLGFWQAGGGGSASSNLWPGAMAYQNIYDRYREP